MDALRRRSTQRHRVLREHLGAVLLLVSLLAFVAEPSTRDRLRGIPSPPPVVPVSSALPRFPDDGLDRLIVRPIESDHDGVPVDDATDETEIVHGHPAVDALAATPGIVTVRALGDGSYAVVCNDRDVVDPGAFDVVDDVPMGLTGDPYEHYQWSLHNGGDELSRLPDVPSQLEGADIGWSGALGVATGRGVTIAVIDSGVDFSHPDLRGTAWTNPGERCGNGIDDDGNGLVDDCAGWDFGVGDVLATDDDADPHGTHVAGLIAAGLNGEGITGIAPRARIMDLDVAVRERGTTSVSLSAVAAAVRYAVDHGADIVNLSLATAPGTSREAVEPLADALGHAADAGVAVVVAAGNHAVDLDRTAIYPAALELPNMIVVGASGPDDRPAGFSIRGAETVDLFAPGSAIVSTVPGGGYRFMSGTSQAAPIVAASLALVLEHLGDAPVPAAVEVLLGAVEPVEELTGAARTSGRLDLGAALGLAPDGGPAPTSEELVVTVDGLARIEPLGGGVHAVDVDIDLDVPAGWFSEDHQWELGLAVPAEEGAALLLDQPIVVNGRARSTGPSGSVRVAPAGASRVGVAMTLSEGDYALLLDAVPLDDPSQRLGPTHVLPFRVSEAADQDAAAPASAAASGAPTETEAHPSGEGLSDRPGRWVTDDAGVATWRTSGWAGSGWSSSGGSTWGTSSWGSGAVSSGGGGVGTSDWQSGAISSGGGGVGTSDWQSGAISSGGGGVGTSDWQSGAISSGGDSDGAGEAEAPVPTIGPPDSVIIPSPEGAAGGSDAPESPLPPVDLDHLQPTPPGSGSAVEGSWEVRELSSSIGRVGALDRITITGSFPEEVYVWFGDRPGTVLRQTSRSLSVQTPVVDEPVVVDLSLRRSGSGAVLELPDAFAFHVVDLQAWAARHPVGVGTGGETVSPQSPEPAAGTEDPATEDPAGGDQTSTIGPAGDGGTSASSPSEPAIAITADDSVDVVGDHDGDLLGRAVRLPRPRIGPGRPLGDGRTAAVLEGLDPFTGTAPCPSRCQLLER